MGCAVEIGAAWMRAIANPVPPVLSEFRPAGSYHQEMNCDEPGGLASLPLPISTPSSTPRPISRPRYASLMILRPESATWTYRGAVQSNGPAGRAHVITDRRRGWLPPWLVPGKGTCLRDCHWMRTRVIYTGPRNLRECDENSAGGPRAPIRTARCVTIDGCSAGRNRNRGLIDSGARAGRAVWRATATSRWKTTT
jgi:4-hydroxy-3-polyprenylbenzoate decarboxylase